MKSFTVTEKDEGRRIGRVVAAAFPDMPKSVLFKAFRKRDVRVNGVRVREDHTVHRGDSVEVYVVDAKLLGMAPNGGPPWEAAFSVVHEDADLLIVNKRQGIPVHPDPGTPDRTLIDLVRQYLSLSDGRAEPALCHRLDRNTGGLVLLAKNAESLGILQRKMKDREILKFYQCLVQGRMEKPSATLRAYLTKDECKSRVFIRDRGEPGSVEIVTRYRTLCYDPDQDVSRLEVELVTGRTHQIRAHLAHIGHPVAGDGKYGTNAANKRLHLRYQALWACRLVFAFRSSAGRLDYLQGKTFEVPPDFY